MSLLNNKKGKWIVGGICAFALVATASTGLAAWVIGQNVPDNGTGNIGFQTEIIDKNVVVEVNENDDHSVYFGPKAIESAVITPSDGDEEDLYFTVSGKVTYNPEFSQVNEVTLSIPALPESWDGYVVLPSEFTKNEETGLYKATITLGEEQDDNNETYKSFNQTFEFGWGEKSGGVNPCAYFTTYEDGIAYLNTIKELTANHEFTFTVSPVLVTASN